MAMKKPQPSYRGRLCEDTGRRDEPASRGKRAAQGDRLPAPRSGTSTSRTEGEVMTRHRLSTRARTHTHMCAHTRTHTCTHTHVHTLTCTHAHTRAHTSGKTLKMTVSKVGRAETHVEVRCLHLPQRLGKVCVCSTPRANTEKSMQSGTFAITVSKSEWNFIKYPSKPQKSKKRHRVTRTETKQ